MSHTSSQANGVVDKGLDKDGCSTDTAKEVIGDRDWLERMAYKIVQHQLVHCHSLYDALHMLSLLHEENIALVFSFDGESDYACITLSVVFTCQLLFFVCAFFSEWMAGGTSS